MAGFLMQPCLWLALTTWAASPRLPDPAVQQSTDRALYDSKRTRPRPAKSRRQADAQEKLAVWELVLVDGQMQQARSTGGSCTVLLSPSQSRFVSPWSLCGGVVAVLVQQA